ncbi:MAG: SDR family NAD(P)-dependent oxidoreductase, partial [Acetobacter peroxydans]|nr:SDR family NAD(P)-dependent oxidoreductase [Acetobacter peroxydans]
MGRVAGKVALVTGAANGIGRATALLLAREGARVFVTDLKEQEGAQVVQEIVQAGGQASFLRLDTAD